MRTFDVVENLSTLSKLDFPRRRHEKKVGMIESVFHEKEIEMNAANNGTWEITTKVAGDVKARSELFTRHLKRLGSRAKVLKLVLM